MAENVIRKIYTTQVKEVQGKDRVLEFVGTTEDVDRDGEVIKASAWQVDKYTANPVVQWAHDYGAPPIGKTLSIRQAAKKTIFEIEFAAKEVYDFADTIYKLCKGGFLSATSVGFIPIEFDKAKKDGDPARTYTKVELLEISIVPVPSNPQALVTAREAGIITVKEFEAVTKPEVTENYIRIPNPKDKGKHDGHKIRTMDLSAKDGIKALYCVECKTIITYLFDKDKFDKAKAEAWVKEHAKGINQSEIADEIDYLVAMIDEAGLSNETSTAPLLKCISKALHCEIEVRLPGGDMPVTNKSAIRDMVAPVQKMLDAHHEAHMKTYEGCSKALKEMAEIDYQNALDGPVVTPQKESFEDYVKKAIQRNMEAK